VKHIVLVEIDPKVIQASQECLQMVPSEIWKDTRVEIIHQEAAKYLDNPGNHNKFDIILADTWNLLGSRGNLLESTVFKAIHASLRPNGIVCTQVGNMWTDSDHIRNLVAVCADIFDTAEYATTNVPSYPGGQIGFILSRKGDGFNRTRGCSVPLRIPSFQQDLQWYNPLMHRSAFALPQYVIAELNAVNHYHDEDDQDKEGDRCFVARGCTIQ
jgi:spermidine synthase